MKKEELIENLKEYFKELAKKDKYSDHIEKTPERFLNFLDEFTEGYHIDINQEVKKGVFDNKDMNHSKVSVNNIEFTTLCIHHLLPFYGSINVEYIPDKKIVGLSKIPRICSILAKRFNLQENFTKSIAENINKILEPRCVKVTVTAKHGCVSCRGIRSTHSYTDTEYEIDNRKKN
jgi:GTP cyclohydrolase IA